MPSPDDKYLPFWEHLEILRWHIIRSLVAILAVAFFTFLSKKFVFHTLLLGPTHPNFLTYRILCYLSQWLNVPALCIQPLPLILHNRQLPGQFSMHMRTSLVVGFVGAFPYVLWELWRFVKPGIPIKRHISVQVSIFIVSLLFILGALFGYYIITPLVIHFLASYQLDPSVVNRFDLVSYMSTVITLTLACSFMFQLPIVVYFFTKIGIITARSMRAYRRQSVIVILILAAVITPPDVMSQLLIATPLVLLYEGSILVAQFVENKTYTP